MSISRKARNFQSKVFAAAKWQLDKLTQGFPMPIELLDISIDVERLRMKNGNFTSYLQACCEDDMAPGEDFYVEANLNIDDRKVVSANTVQIDNPSNVVIDFSKIEVIYVSEEEKVEFKKEMPDIDVPLEAINEVFVTRAIQFGILWALGRL